MGELEFTDFFFACVKNLTSEEVMRRSPNGKKVNPILDGEAVTKVAVLLVDKIISCIGTGKKAEITIGCINS